MSFEDYKNLVTSHMRQNKHYYTIAFLQGEDYETYKRETNDEDQDHLMSPFMYLYQWYYGTESEINPYEKPPWGETDSKIDGWEGDGGVFHVYENERLGYVSLTLEKETV